MKTNIWDEASQTKVNNCLFIVLNPNQEFTIAIKTRLKHVPGPIGIAFLFNVPVYVDFSWTILPFNSTFGIHLRPRKLNKLHADKQIEKFTTHEESRHVLENWICWHLAANSQTLCYTSRRAKYFCDFPPENLKNNFVFLNNFSSTASTFVDTGKNVNNWNKFFYEMCIFEWQIRSSLNTIVYVNFRNGQCGEQGTEEPTTSHWIRIAIHRTLLGRVRDDCFQQHFLDSHNPNGVFFACLLPAAQRHHFGRIAADVIEGLLFQVVSGIVFVQWK